MQAISDGSRCIATQTYCTRVGNKSIPACKPGESACWLFRWSASSRLEKGYVLTTCTSTNSELVLVAQASQTSLPRKAALACRPGV